MESIEKENAKTETDREDCSTSSHTDYTYKVL